jgi:DNA-binding PadR family transcriptional regulator
MFRHHHRHHACRSPSEFGFGGGMGRGARHWGRGGPQGRVFDQGDLRFVALKLIAERPRHGYEIIKAIEEGLAGAYSPSPGVVYPTLTFLEELGYIAVGPTEGSKKLYAITPEGEAFLAENAATVDAIFGRMAEAKSRSGGRNLQVMRAMENLRTALKLRFSQGPLTDEQVRAVTAAIDAAAVAIERA